MTTFIRIATMVMLVVWAILDSISPFYLISALSVLGVLWDIYDRMEG